MEPSEPCGAKPAQDGGRGATCESAVEALWSGGGPVDLSDVVALVSAWPVAEAVHGLRADQRRRWEASRPVSANEYLGLYPALRTHLEAAVDLIWSEFVARESLGPPPDLAEYRAAYPMYAELLARQHEVHAWLRDSGGKPAREHVAVPCIPGFGDLEVVGRGGMGIVYRAYQRSLGRYVALKALPPLLAADPECLRRFRNEAAIAAKIGDTRILPVYDICESDGFPFLVMPFVDGQDMDRWLSRLEAGGATSETEATVRDPGETVLGVLDEVIAAVAALHRAGVIHRDIKPSNVLLDRSLRVWLGDFGLARFAAEAGATASGTRLGTPGYMSPEQWTGSRDVDYRTDVFGLGVLIHRAVTGRLPYATRPLDESTPLPGDPEEPSGGLHAGLRPVMLRALRCRAEDRFGSAVELLEAWEEARSGLVVGPPASPAGPARAIHRPWAIGKSAATAACTLAATFALALGVRAWLQPLASENPRPRGTLGDASPLPERVRVTLPTTPLAERAVFVPLDPLDGTPLLAQACEVSAREGDAGFRVELRPGDYIVEVARGDRFQEVRRRLPTRSEIESAPDGMPVQLRCLAWRPAFDGSIEWAAVDLPGSDIAMGMVRFEGAAGFRAGSDVGREGFSGARGVDVRAFYLDAEEVTFGRSAAATGRGARKLGVGCEAPARDDDPVVCISYFGAMHQAELMGKRLPDEEEYEYAATNGGATAFPWGDSPAPIAGRPWEFGRVGVSDFDRTPTRPPVRGLYSNVAEWTASWMSPSPAGRPLLPPSQFALHRVVKGGPVEVARRIAPPVERAAEGPRRRLGYEPGQTRPGVGFRCARSVTPRFLGRGP